MRKFTIAKVYFVFILNAFAAVDCRIAILRSTESLGDPYLGKPIHPPLLNELRTRFQTLIPDGEITEIDHLNPNQENQRSAGIYRVSFKSNPNKQQAMVIKIYGNGDAVREKAVEEVKKMQNLAEWLTLDSKAAMATSPFKVAPCKFVSLENNISALAHDEVKGRSLQDLLDDPLIKTSYKDLLLDLYGIRAAHYSQTLFANGLERNIRTFREKNTPNDLYLYFHPAFSAPIAPNSEIGYYYLKPDQVIVSLDTLEMTIIDPF